MNGQASVQMRVDFAGSDFIPHTFLSVTHPDGSRTEYGLVPATPMSPWGIGKIDITGPDSAFGEPHEYDLTGPKIPLTDDQYQDLMRDIEASIRNPPDYLVTRSGPGDGTNCTGWAVDIWNKNGLPEQFGVTNEWVWNPYSQGISLKLNDWWDYAKNGIQFFDTISSDSGKFINDLFDTLKQSIIDLNPEIFDLFNNARITASPLVFDLDGDGIEISQLGKYSPILFDHDANGVKTGTAWLKSDDALLVLDRNGNGTIDSGQELFGNNTLLSNGNKAADGYAALSDLDSNGDGMIDAQDAQFDELRLWRDLNQDGISDTGELFRLAELGITQINLDKTAGSQTLSDGTRLDGSASFLMNGETRSYTDAWFAENRFYRTFNDSVPLTAEAALLPEMKGAGAVRDLREAASLDTGLATLVTDMQSDDWVSREQMMAQLDVLVHQWARTADFQTLFRP